MGDVGARFSSQSLRDQSGRAFQRAFGFRSLSSVRTNFTQVDKASATAMLVISFQRQEDEFIILNEFVATNV